MGLLDGILGKKPQPKFDPGPPAPNFKMRKTEDFIKNDPAERIGDPNDSIGRRFAQQREKIQGAQNAALGKNTSAIQRRFAAMGASGSGAQIRLEKQAADEADQARNAAFTDLALGQEEANLARDTQQADMNFKQKVFNFERGSKMHELDLAERQQKLDAHSTEFNKRMAQFQAQPPQGGFISNVLDGIL